MRKYVSSAPLSKESCITVIEDLACVLMFYLIYDTSCEKRIEREALSSILPLFVTSLINSIIQEYKC